MSFGSSERIPNDWMMIADDLESNATTHNALSHSSATLWLFVYRQTPSKLYRNHRIASVFVYAYDLANEYMYMRNFFLTKCGKLTTNFRFTQYDSYVVCDDENSGAQCACPTFSSYSLFLIFRPSVQRCVLPCVLYITYETNNQQCLCLRFDAGTVKHCFCLSRNWIVSVDLSASSV